MVNLKPVVPGHILVCPKRVVQKIKDLTKEEMGSLFKCAQEIQRMFEQVFGCTNFSISIQDGAVAG